MPQQVYCWRCQIDIPMLDEHESQLVPLLTQCGKLMRTRVARFCAECGYASTGVSRALARVRQIFFPVEWAVLIRSRNPASVMTHGLVLVGFNALFTSMYCMIALVCVVEVIGKAA